MVVYGVNHDRLLKADERMISNGSCTTNCLAPLAKALHDAIGIESGLMTTIHAYTGDQPTHDRRHNDLYRARAAAMSMIPTSTGAARALGEVLPELAGRLDGSAMRVPTPNVSAVDLTFVAQKDVTAADVNEVMAEAAAGPMKGILGYDPEPKVSVDFNHTEESAIFAPDQTKVIGQAPCAGAGMVRQRMGLFLPHGRRGGGHGPAELSRAGQAPARAARLGRHTSFTRPLPVRYQTRSSLPRGRRARFSTMGRISMPRFTMTTAMAVSLTALGLWRAGERRLRRGRHRDRPDADLLRHRYRADRRCARQPVGRIRATAALVRGVARAAGHPRGREPVARDRNGGLIESQDPDEDAIQGEGAT